MTHAICKECEGNKTIWKYSKRKNECNFEKVERKATDFTAILCILTKSLMLRFHQSIVTISYHGFKPLMAS